MKTQGPTFQQRDLTKQMTVKVVIQQPVRHRLLFLVGYRIMAFGFWLMGFAGTECEQVPDSTKVEPR
jgi:hypothetical protein